MTAQSHARFPLADTRIVWVAVLFAVTGAEIAIALDGVRFATIVLLLTAVALVWYAGIASFTARALALALTLVPLLRVLSLGLPLIQFSAYVWSLLVGIPAIGAVVVVIQQLGLAPAELNLTVEQVPRQLAVGLVGIPLGAVAYLFVRPSYPLAETPLEGVVAIIALCLAAALDEVIFRGVLQETALVTLGPWGIVYVSSLYAALQIESRSAGTVIVAFVVSMAFAWYVRRTRTVCGVVVAHTLANIGLYLVFPLIARGQGG